MTALYQGGGSPRRDARPRRRARFEARLVEAADPRLGEPTFNVSKLAEGLEMSVRTLQLRMQKLALPTPATWLRGRRLERGRRLLEDHAYETVGEVAAAVGMSPSYFSRAFRVHAGVCPSELLKC